MLVELGLVEQRHKAVLGSAGRGHDQRRGPAQRGDPADRAPLAEALCRLWACRSGRSLLAARPPVRIRCAPEIEVRILELREAHPGWGPRTLRHQLEKEDVDPLPGRSSIYRCLVRHGLVDPQKRRRKREDYRRWERTRSMELWQMDIMGGVKLDGRQRAQDHHRPRRPLPLLRLGASGASGHRSAGLRGSGSGHAPPRRPRPDPHRQRQGVHRPLRPGQRRGALRPHLPGERHQAPAHRSALSHHHRQGGALPQDGASGVPRRPGLRLASKRPRTNWTPGWEL